MQPALQLSASCRYGAQLVLAGELTVGRLNAFLLYALYVAASIGMLTAVLNEVVTAVSDGR